MSSQCMVPDWNLSRQRQELVQTTNQNQEEAGRFPRVQHRLHQIPNDISDLGSLPNYGVAELTWENGHPTMHGLGGLHNSGPTKPTWVRTNGTLESIVHQATCHSKQQLINPCQEDNQINQTKKNPATASSGHHAYSEPVLSKKRRWSDSEAFPKYKDHNACASENAMFHIDHANDTNTIVRNSFASPPRFKAKTTDEDSDCIGASEHDNPEQEEDRDNKTEMTARSHSCRGTRAAAVHNLSERRRRDRINQKMRALQKLVPNANKTDKSSMLDEVISYLKQLQAQVHLMSSARNLSTPSHHQVMMSLGLQQQQQQMQQQQYLQMSLLAARMGMNMDMFGMNNLARGLSPCLPPFVHPAMATATAVATAMPTTFVHPSPNHVVPPLMVPPSHVPAVRPNHERPSPSSVPITDPYSNFLAQQDGNIMGTANWSAQPRNKQCSFQVQPAR